MMSGSMSADEDETTGLSKTGRMSLKKVDMLVLLYRWGMTESIIKEATGSMTLPKIVPLRAFFSDGPGHRFWSKRPLVGRDSQALSYQVRGDLTRRTHRKISVR